MTVCRGSLFTTQIKWALYEEPASPSCTPLCSQQRSWGPHSALPNSDQLSQSCPQRCMTVLMEFYLIWEWLDISSAFHNSQAMWPNDRHAWQQLLLHSLTKLGVHWVCAGWKTFNVQSTFRTRWMKCISLERQKHQDKHWEKEVQKYKLQLFPPEICTSFFFADTRGFLPSIFFFLFYGQLCSHGDMRQIRQYWWAFSH